MIVILFLLHFSSDSIPLLLGGKWYHNTPDSMMSNVYNAGKTGQAWLYWLSRIILFIPFVFLQGYSTKKMSNASQIIQKVKLKKYRFNTYSIVWFLYLFFIVIIIFGPLVAFFMHVFHLPIISFFKNIIFGFVDLSLGLPIYLIVINSVLLAFVSGIISVAIAFGIGIIIRLVRTTGSLHFLNVLTIFPFLFGSVGIGMFVAWLCYGKIVSAFAVGVLCHVLLNYPFAYRVISAQLDLYHADIHYSAQTFGATTIIALKTVAIPFFYSAFGKAFCISFGLSLTEVGAGSVLQGHMGMTIPMAIRIYRNAGMHAELFGLNIILLVLVLLVSYVLSRWME